MATFTSGTIAVANATAVKLLDSADVDRQVRLYNPGGNQLRLAFTSGSASTGVSFQGLDNNNSAGGLVVPADEELWTYQSSGSSCNVELIATSVGR